MSDDFVTAFHRLAFFRKVPVPKLAGIVRDARGCITTTDSVEAIREKLLGLMPPDDAARLLREVDRDERGDRLTANNQHQAANAEGGLWRVVMVDEDALKLFRTLELVLDDPPEMAEWLATLDYLERAVRDVTRGGVSG